MSRQGSGSSQQDEGYKLSYNEMLSYGFKYGDSWAEDKRELESAFDEADRANREDDDTNQPADRGSPSPSANGPDDGQEGVFSSEYADSASDSGSSHVSEQESRSDVDSEEDLSRSSESITGYDSDEGHGRSEEVQSDEAPEDDGSSAGHANELEDDPVGEHDVDSGSDGGVSGEEDLGGEYSDGSYSDGEA
ncbi:hypothetical protein PLICRDRAFT_33687 [Plicaturopsis crispa FD-325 SS-3]|nr:hypothetical protein PLICRDRAFT_33687 [Plicaturopsis crispa FD-325 SS-3]